MSEASIPASTGLALRSQIVRAAFDFVEGDNSRGLMAINAVFSAGIDLVRASNMSAETRQAVATMLFHDLTGQERSTTNSTPAAD
ncbi:hypothetical protein [Kordiimonas sp.]|uniref:hypothetical protein n=1 Tax=Kordiimonas sp. TaxID=1970157 RepID=UPI003A8FBD34